MKRIVILTLLLLSFSHFQANAQTLVYDANAEIRKVDSFKAIEVSGGMTVYLAYGTEQTIAVSAENAEYTSRIKLDVSNGVLRINPSGGSWNGWKSSRLKAYITVSNLESIDLSGAAVIKLTNDFVVNTLKVRVSGASVFKGTLKGNTVKLDASGASVVELNGNLELMSMNVHGASLVKTYELQSATCVVEASGASSVGVTATKELLLQASGASSIGYKGSAVVRKVESSGASSIKKKD